MITSPTLSHVFRPLFMFACGIYASSLLAWDTTVPQKADLPYLPAYCTAKLEYLWEGGRPPPDLDYWKQAIGREFEDVHHYCWALNFLRRAERAPKQDRGDYYRAAILNIDYCLGRAAESYVLEPELLVNKGKTLAKMGKPGDAIQTLAKAIEAKPDWGGGYAALSDLYRDVGMKQEAIAITEKGLEAVPTSQTLARRLAELKARPSQKEPPVSRPAK